MNFGSLAIVSMGSLWKWFSVVFEKFFFYTFSIYALICTRSILVFIFLE